MKLRNRQTGEIADVKIDTYNENGKGDRICLSVRDGEDLYRCIASYPSLAELNAEWEDYAPQEPLIKDEKIRKAVRAWAGCNLLDGDDRVFLSKPTFDCKILSLEYGMLNFDVYYDDESLCNKEYTIAELCGKEEE